MLFSDQHRRFDEFFGDFFDDFFFRKWRQFCSPECAATDGIFRICAARRQPRKLQANGTLRRFLRLFGII